MSDKRANIETIWIPIEDLVPNTGQIEGVPKNPRIIRDKNFKNLLKSIQDDPEMMRLNNLWVFPLRKKYVVIVGNQRLQAVKDLGWDKVPCKIIPKETPKDKIRGWIIKENRHAGEDDLEALLSWDINELADFGLIMLGYPTEKKTSSSEQRGVIVMCGSHDEQEEVYNWLTDKGKICKTVIQKANNRNWFKVG